MRWVSWVYEGTVKVFSVPEGYLNELGLSEKKEQRYLEADD